MDAQPNSGVSPRMELGLLLLPALLVVATRVPLWGEIYFNLDATHLGLALERFDPNTMRPHPPGYPVYVLLGRAVHALGASPVRTYQWLSLLFTLVALAALWRLGRRLGGPLVGLLAAAAYAFNPVSWFYGIVGESYAAEGACSALIGLLALAALERSRRALLLLALVAGLSGGVRTSVLTFALPLCLFAAWRGRFALGQVALAAAVGGAAVLAWLVPTALLSGGLERYLEITRTQVVGVVGRSWSPLMGASSAFVEANLRQFVQWLAATVDIWGAAGLVVWLVSALRWRRRRGGAPETAEPGTGGDGSGRARWGFFLVWMLPALLFFALMFVSKAGYLLFVAPPICLLAALGLGRLPRLLPARGTLLLWAVVALLTLVDLLHFVQPEDWTGRPAAQRVAVQDAVAKGLFAALEKAAARERVAVVYSLALVPWRTACIYLPGVDNYWLETPQTRPNHPPGYRYCKCRAGKMACVPREMIPRDNAAPRRLSLALDRRVSRVYWLVDPRSRLLAQVAAALPLQRQTEEPGITLRSTPVTGRLPVTLGGLTLSHAEGAENPMP